MINTIIKILLFITLSSMMGVLLGTQFKKPNSELIKSSYSAKSEWRSKKIIELAKSKESFFSFKKFDFNWYAGILGGLFFLLITLFFGSQEFRSFLYHRIFFVDERGKM